MTQFQLCGKRIESRASWGQFADSYIADSLFVISINHDAKAKWETLKPETWSWVCAPKVPWARKINGRNWVTNPCLMWQFIVFSFTFFYSCVLLNFERLLINKHRGNAKINLSILWTNERQTTALFIKQSDKFIYQTISWNFLVDRVAICSCI